jgi:hypothetical protein
MVAVDDEVRLSDFVDDDRGKSAVGKGLLDPAPALPHVGTARQKARGELRRAPGGADDALYGDRADADVALLEETKPPGDFVEREEVFLLPASQQAREPAVGVLTPGLLERGFRVGLLPAQRVISPAPCDRRRCALP